MLGEIALYSFIVVLLSGVHLTLFFKPSMVEIVYNGSYVPLMGVEMSEAYASTLTSPSTSVAACSCVRSTTGRAVLHRRHLRAPLPRLLHRGVPQAA